MPNLSVSIGKLKLKNPVMVASGTFGYAEEFTDFINLKDLGAVVTKTITLKPRRGNVPPRTCETPSGLLNSIGLENPGIEVFIREKLPSLRKAGVPIIVSIASEGDPAEFVKLAQRLDEIKEVAAIELNISCPNIRKFSTRQNFYSSSEIEKIKVLPRSNSKLLIAQDAKETYNVVNLARKATSKTIITKLSPNVTDITEIARAVEDAGSDAVSLINTFLAMAIDVNTKKPRLGNITGGLSGPAIKPIAVRMTWEAAKAVKIPVIGIGGIMTVEDALEFIIAGASAVQVGTANFINPSCAVDIIEGLTKYLKQNKIEHIKKLIGLLKT
jgi:dihydroorotate dehydrogenase (NAD+) catalytic subunit